MTALVLTNLLENATRISSIEGYSSVAAQLACQAGRDVSNDIPHTQGAVFL